MEETQPKAREEHRAFRKRETAEDCAYWDHVERIAEKVRRQRETGPMQAALDAPDSQ